MDSKSLTQYGEIWTSNGFPLLPPSIVDILFVVEVLQESEVALIMQGTKTNHCATNVGRTRFDGGLAQVVTKQGEL